MKLPQPRYKKLQFHIKGKMIYVYATDRVLTFIGNRIDVQDGCWIWKNATPQMTYSHPDLFEHPRNQVTIRIPTLMFKIYKGPIGHNTYLERSCNNWKCVRPDHLESSTREGKIQRRASKWEDLRPEMVGQELDVFETSSLGLGSSLDPKRNSFHYIP